MSESSYRRRTDEQIHELATDIFGGRVFHSFSLGHDEAAARLLPMVFMPLALSGEETRDYMLKNNIVAVYEHYDKAAPRSINGYPMFFSMHLLDDEDNKRVFKRVLEIQQAVNGLQEKDDE